ncbi:DUF11 domain-containing protein [Candidatus Saccharibacteria bacterium]|nr:DUF11 domain-containing protein [Candidatus Saccharibacteria bacterium]
MSKLIAFIRSAPKRTSAVLAIVAAVVVVPVTLFAWGPIRPTYTIDSPADHITFNSITNNPNIGDERNFVGIRESGTTNQWSDDMTVVKGKAYTVRMYVHNNAASSLNLVAENVTAKFNLPTTTSKSIQVNGFLSASNATPTEVYDHAIFSSTENFNLAYTSGSLKFENNSFGAAGTTLPESIFTSAGAKLGYDKLDGRIPGCFQFSGYVTFQVKPQFAAVSKFTMSKMVSKKGDNKWVETYAAKPGETVDYLIQYKNVGEAQQDDVTFRDTLPAGVTYINGSTTFGNSKTPAGTKASDNITNGTGINVGSYAPGANAWSIFSAKVSDDSSRSDDSRKSNDSNRSDDSGNRKDNLLNCGNNTLVNKAKVTTGGGSIEDTANVTVFKVCVVNKVNVVPVAQVAPQVAPAELPKTGAGENIAAVFGLGSLITSIGYYITSRRLGINQ